VWYEKELDAKNPIAAIELFDLENDIGEQQNLAKKVPEKAQQLYQKFKQWQRAVGAQTMRRNPGYDPSMPTTEEGD
jgi:hypothetical protein